MGEALKDLPDEELMALYQEGNSPAFTELFGRYEGLLYNFFLGRLRVLLAGKKDLGSSLALHVRSQGAVLSLSNQVDLNAFSAGGIATCVTWWAGLFILAGCLIAGKHRLGRVRMAFVASTAAVSVGLIMLGTYFCPKLELLSWWQASVLGGLLGTLGGPGLSHLAFGFAYAVLPTFLVTLYFGRHLYGPGLRHGLWAAAAFLALLLPSLYIQCCLLRLTLAVLLAAGVALGGFLGPLAALGLYRFSPRVA